MTKFCTSVDIQDVITCATFCDDRLRGLGVARGRISRFPIDLHRRPYNTLALPCECVITRKCVDRSHQTRSVGAGSDYLQLMKFWPSYTPGKGSAAGRKFLAPPTTSSAQCLRLSERFFIHQINGRHQ